MTTSTPTRVEAQTLPVDTDGTDARFTDAGFTLGATNPDDPLYRTVYLPAGWSRRGDRILDRYGRERVCIFAWSSLGMTYAHMHLTDLRVYLRQCVADGLKPVLDPEWATQTAVFGAAYAEIGRCEDRIEHYSHRGTPRDVEVECARRDVLTALTRSLTLDMTAVA